MDNEVKNFIKVWIAAITCLTYCYYISARLSKGTIRFISLLPVFYLFLILPLYISAVHLCGPTAFFLSWLANFKLLLFSFDRGPLSSPSPNPFHFIALASLPIKVKQPQDLKKPKTRLIFFPVKTLLLALIVRVYDFRLNLPPYMILALYCCHVYLGVELVLALCTAPAGAIFGFELEPQFNEPYLATSLQDFWGRRWNLMVPSILRPTVFTPVRSISARVIGPRWAPFPAVMAAFTVSGVMHELIYYYFTRVNPTWEVTLFFVLHGMCTAVEMAVKKAATDKWHLHRAVSGPLTLVFLAVTGKWLFFPQLLRNGVDQKAISEYPILFNFVKANFPIKFLHFL